MTDRCAHKCLDLMELECLRTVGNLPTINTNDLEIREYFHNKKCSLLDVKLQARKLSVCNVVVAEIDIRADGNVVHEEVHRYAEGQARVQT